MPAGAATVGRDAGCEVTVEGPGVSGKHCRLRWDGRTWTVEDLGSRNGTAVNGVPVIPAEPVPLGPGDVLTLAGKHHFTPAYGRPAAPKGPRLLAAALAAAGAAGGGAAWWFLS